MAKKKWEIWPVGIVLSMATFMVGIIVAVFIMLKNDVPLVSDDYYAQEIAFQERIDKENRATEAGQTPIIKFLPATDAMEIRIPGFQPTALNAGKITFFRPSNPKKDFSMDLRPEANGTQWVDLRKVDAGLWVVQLDWSVDGKSFYYEENLGL